MNIVEVIRRETAAHRRKTALVEADREITYEELFSLMEGMAAELKAGGVGPTQRVALICEDGIDYVVASLAVLSLGAALVPVSPSHSLEEVATVLAEMDVGFSICTRDVFAREPAPPVALKSVGRRTLLFQRRAVREEPSRECAELNTAFIRFSSGTTGASKGVLLSHEAIVDRTDAADKALRITSSDTLLWVLSMSYHFVVSILLFLRRGATLVLCGGDVMASLLDGLSRFRATLLYASPFHYQILTNSELFSAQMLGDVRLAVSTAMRLPEAEARRFREKFGLLLAEAYGIIEVGLPFVNCSGDPAKQGSVGRALPDYEVKIVGADAGGVGEVWLRGKGMFDAYVAPWQKRDQVTVDGWFKTGDLGRVDSEGFLFLCGRDSNIINFAGMKVFPEEVEAVLNRHPAVRESLVYGTPHAQYGELPCADVILESEAGEPETAEIRRFCYRYLAPFKVPKQVRCVPRLERTASGKLKRWERSPGAEDGG